MAPLVRALCRRLLPSEADAEEATQQALLQLFEHASDYDSGRDALPWVLAIAGNAARTLRQRHARRREDFEVLERSVDAEAEDRLLAAELRAAVEVTLGTLDALDAETLRLAMDQRPTGATFRKRLERAIRRFRAAWRTQHG